MIRIKWDYEEGPAREWEGNDIALAVRQYVVHNEKRKGALYDFAYIFVACGNRYFRVDSDSIEITEMFEHERSSDGSDIEEAAPSEENNTAIQAG